MGVLAFERCNMSGPLVPPFTEETARAKVRAAEDAWNSRDPDRVSMAYSENSHWRNRAEIFEGREAIRAFLQRKWDSELDYRLVKEMWAWGERGWGGREGVERMVQGLGMGPFSLP